MRKFLLTVGCLMAFHASQAQTAATPSWSQVIKGSVAEASELNTGAPTTVGQDGSVFMTGNYTQLVTVGQNDLDPIANSAYLIKYNSNGELAWSVGLKGAATITSITTDENNNVYVAGTLAEEVIVGSTDNNTQTISGKPDETIEVSSFIAAYDADGKLKAAKAFFTTPNEEITSLDPFYFSDVYFGIDKLAVSGDKLYASATFRGDVSIEDMKWAGMYMNMWGMIFDRNSAGVFSLNPTTLTDAESVALVQISEQNSDQLRTVEGFNFTVNQDTVFVGFVGTGSLSYSAGGKQEIIEMEVNADTYSYEHAYTVSAIKGTDVKTKTFNSVAHAQEASYDYIGQMTVENGNLYIGGTFQQTFAFDNSKQSTGASDLFVAALDKNTLGVTWTAVSGIEEGDANYNNENFSAMTATDGKVALYGNCEDTQNKTITKFTALDIENGVVTTGADAGFVTGADSKNGITAIQTISDLDVILDVYKKETGINLPSYTLNAERVGNTFFFDQASDVQVYDLEGKVVMSLQAVSSLNIEGLQKGIYILATQNGAVKVIR